MLCAKCNKNEAPITEYGPVWCKPCNDSKSPMQKCDYEFTTDDIREQRQQYFNSVVQPYRQGELSREFVDAHPQKTQGMLKEGIITHDQVRRAKNVWSDLKGWNYREKSQ